MPKRGERTSKLSFGDATDPLGFGLMVPEYLESMEALGYAERTVENRRHGLHLFTDWAGERGVRRPGEVTRPILERYRKHLFHLRKPNGEPLTMRAQHFRLVPIRAFFKWAAKENRILFNPASELELPKLEKRLPKHVLSVSEAEAVLSGPDVKTPGGLRDRAMLECFYSTGIRRSELANLKLFDLDCERETLMVRQGKGKKDRMIPIGDRAISWITKYIDQSRPRFAREPDDGWMFLNAGGLNFTPGRLTTLVRQYVLGADIGKTGACHLFRHTMATLMLEGGADIRFIQQMLGHVDISTTQIYTQVSMRKLQEIYLATHPGAKLERKDHLEPESENGQLAFDLDHLFSSLAAEAVEEETE